MKKHLTTTYSADEVRAMEAAGDTASDWKKVQLLTDDDIVRSLENDPDWANFQDLDWSKADIVYPLTKSAISIRLDDDVIEFFKSGGKGYQSRINTVLRHFVKNQRV